MTFIKYLLIVSILTLSLNAVSQEKEWTILVFMNADNNLEPFGFSDFAEISSVGSSDNINIIVQADRFGGDAYLTTNPDWKGALRFKIEKNMEFLPANAIKDLGETNMGDPNVLRDFVSWGMSAYPAKKFMLIIWDHGDGWRFLDSREITLPARNINIFLENIRHNILGDRNFKRIQNLMESTETVESSSWPATKAGRRVIADTVLNAEPVTLVPNSAYRGISHDETNNDVFYNREIQDCLKGLLDGRKLDVIGFDACLMEMVETGFAFRDVAKYMIGSEELEPGEGWDYSLWLQKLNQNPKMDPKQLCENIVDAYHQAYPNKFDVTLSAADLTMIDSFCNSFSSLSSLLIHKMKIEFKNIRTARGMCIPFAPNRGLHGIDIKTFLLQLNRATKDNEIKSAIQSAIGQLEPLIIKNYAAKGRKYDDNIRSFGSFGLSVYFPESKILFENDVRAENGYNESNNKFPVEFVKRHTWDNLLREYYKY